MRIRYAFSPDLTSRKPHNLIRVHPSAIEQLEGEEGVGSGSFLIRVIEVPDWIGQLIGEIKDQDDEVEVIKALKEAGYLKD